MCHIYDFRHCFYFSPTIGLIGYVIAAALNFADIQNAWQMIVVFFAIVIIYAFVREKKVKEIVGEK